MFILKLSALNVTPPRSLQPPTDVRDPWDERRGQELSWCTKRNPTFPCATKTWCFSGFPGRCSAALLLSAPRVWCWIFSEDEAVPGGFPGAELELRAAGGGAGKGRACVCVSLSEPHKLC